MVTTKTRVICPECGRSIVLRNDRQVQGIARHGRQQRPPCPGTGLTPVSGELTSRQLEFFKRCWRVGDALPVARMLNVTYTGPELAAAADVDAVVQFLIDHARDFITTAVRDYRSGVTV